MNRREAFAGAASARDREPTGFHISWCSRLSDWLVGRPPPPPPHIQGVHKDDLSKGYVAERYIHAPDKNRLGICCSGGGIRSASFSLGALQVLRERPGPPEGQGEAEPESPLATAEYLAAVSGGCYIAAAHSLTTVLTPQEERAEAFGEVPAWAPGSPEEEHLRNHSSYLAPGLVGKLWALSVLLFGFIRHILPIAALLYLAGYALGLLYAHGTQPGLQLDGGRGIDLHFPDWQLWLTVGLLGVAAALLVVRFGFDRMKKPSDTAMSAVHVWHRRVIVVNLVALIVAFVGVPALVVLVRVLGAWLPNHTDFVDPPDLHLLIELALRAVVPLLTAVLVAAVGALGALRLARASGKLVAPYVGLVFAWSALAVPLVAGADIGSQAGWTGYSRRVIFVGVLLLYLFYRAVCTDLVQSSMHSFYKERLSSAFVIGRKGGMPGWIRAFEPPYSESLNVSSLGELQAESQQGRAELTTVANVKLPKLVACAAVNLSGNVVPPGRQSASFTFEAERIGGPLTGYVDTMVLEESSRPGVVTVPALMAISGAAVAPSMGWMTRPWMRILFALFNLRLGVWIRNPLSLPGVETASGRALEPPGEGGAEIPLWDPPSKRPGMRYVLSEIFGLNDLRKRYVYVSDGGHWENLGLVELLRRGCGQILCFDAAGDSVETFHTLGGAVAFARSELGVDIEIDLTDLEVDPVTGESQSDHACGTICYPNGQKGVLVYAKLAKRAGARQDVRSFGERDARFPNHSTSDQFFDDRKFESYRALGRDAARGAVATLNGWREKEGMATFPVELCRIPSCEPHRCCSCRPADRRSDGEGAYSDHARDRRGEMEKHRKDVEPQDPRAKTGQGSKDEGQAKAKTSRLRKLFRRTGARNGYSDIQLKERIVAVSWS